MEKMIVEMASQNSGVQFRRFTIKEKEKVLSMISYMDHMLDEQDPNITPSMVICSGIANLLHIAENTARELYLIVTGYGDDAFPKGVMSFSFPYVVEDPLRQGVISEILMYNPCTLMP